jgi:hypothetical protein
MTRHALVPILLSAMVGLTAPAGIVRAEEPAAQVEGRAHFRRGVDFFKEGDYRAALIEFKRAYELAPNYKVLYNLGQTSLELQDYASALRSFEKYLGDGGKEIAAARRTQVEGEIDKLKKRVARVEVTTNVPDAEVFIDDVSVGRTPLAPLAVSAGRRKFSASKGGITATRAVDLAGGDTTTVPLEIVEPVAPAPPAPAAAPVRTPEPPRAPPKAENPRPAIQLAPSPPPPEPSNTGLWLGITATGALAAGTVATGIFALSAKKDFDNTIARYGVDAQTVSDARSKTRTLALVTDILAGTTVIAGGITVITSLGSGSQSKERQRALSVDLTVGGVMARGSF